MSALAATVQRPAESPLRWGRDTLLLTARSLRSIPRVPERLLDVTIQPITVTAPARVAAGAPFDVTWTGPAAAFDEIWLAGAGSPAGTVRMDIRRRRPGPTCAMVSTPAAASTRPVSGGVSCSSRCRLARTKDARPSSQ